MIDVSRYAKGAKNFFLRAKELIADPNALQDYILSHKKQMIVVCALCVLVLFLVTMLIITSPEVSSLSKKNKRTITNPVRLEDALVLPSEPGYPEDFQFYRSQRDTWTKEEAERWFSVPDEKMMSELENANNTVISDILGAAP